MEKITRRWEHFPHQADIGVRGIGPSQAEAFEQIALALTAVITDPQLVMPSKPVNISCQAPDKELLLVDWLNALIYEMATKKMLFSRYQVTIENTRLQATAWGENIQVAKHKPTVEVKGATYTELHLTQDKNGAWIAQCVVDV
ncbi:MAG: archease [Gammaproteobacteria bacterium]|nr:archease [Gammaproteobacteria bacterium]